MKKLVISTVMSLLVAVGYSQDFRFAPLVEKTVTGTQYGAILNFRTKSNWGFGTFYQTTAFTNPEGAQTSNPFWGISVSAPLAKADKINFYFNTRVGIVNQYFLVATPGLETEIRISKAIRISTMMSMRMSYPSALAWVSIKI